MDENKLVCPVCNSNKLMAKYESKFVYAYEIDSDALGAKNTREFLPFVYDRREQIEAKEYIECDNCRTQYPCLFSQGKGKIDCEIFNKDVNEAIHENLGFQSSSGYYEVDK